MTSHFRLIRIRGWITLGVIQHLPVFASQKKVFSQNRVIRVIHLLFSKRLPLVESSCKWITLDHLWIICGSPPPCFFSTFFVIAAFFVKSCDRLCQTVRRNLTMHTPIYTPLGGADHPDHPNLELFFLQRFIWGNSPDKEEQMKETITSILAALLLLLVFAAAMAWPVYLIWIGID